MKPPILTEAQIKEIEDSFEDELRNTRNFDEIKVVRGKEIRRMLEVQRDQDTEWFNAV